MGTPEIPGRALMNRIRAGFILQNTTLNAWCAANGIERTAARHAIYGTWGGPKGRALLARLLRASKVQEGS